MSDDLDHEGLRERLGSAAPPHPDLPALAGRVEHRARRRRTTRRALAAAATATAVALAVVVPMALAGGDDPAAGPAASPTPAPAPMKDECAAPSRADRASLVGTPVWVRFCSGGSNNSAGSSAANVPSDYLVSHLDRLADLTVSTGPTPGPDEGCYPGSTTTFRFQVGYADGGISEVSGFASPFCVARLRGSDLVTGPDGFGPFGVVMAAYGEQHADDFADAAPTTALRCPSDLAAPDVLDVDGPSASVDTGYFLRQRGGRSPMAMPLTAIRGILCTWPPGATRPTQTELTPDQAERIRIGMHALNSAIADCGGDPAASTYTAVLEDRTGTRRTVTVLGGQCSAVSSSDGFGLGFDWLDR